MKWTVTCKYLICSKTEDNINLAELCGVTDPEFDSCDIYMIKDFIEQ